jgi:hypothetical protein
MKFLRSLVLPLALAACCSDHWCQLDRDLGKMPRERAFEAFAHLPAKEQVGLYSWQLRHSRPPASPYEFLLKDNGSAVAPFLLQEAATTSDGYMIQAALLDSLARLRTSDRANLSKSDIRAALSKCRALAHDAEDPICSGAERELVRD